MASYSKTFNISFKILKFIGLWALETDNSLKKNLHYFYRCFSLLIVTLTIFSQFVDLYTVRHDRKKICLNLIISSQMAVGVLMNLMARKRISENNALREDLNRNAEEENDERCKNILSKSAVEMKYLIRIYIWPSYLAFAVLCLFPLFGFESGIGGLIFRQWLPFDVKVSPNYELLYLYQIYVIFVMGSHACSLNLALLGFKISLSAEYDVLQRYLEKINEMYNEEKDNNELDENMKEEIIKNIVIRHQQILLQVYLKV